MAKFQSVFIFIAIVVCSITSHAQLTPEVKARLMSPDLYVRLGVAPTASQDEIKKASRELMKIAHSDRNGGTDEAKDFAQRATQAFELRDEQKRAGYDRDRRFGIEYALDVANGVVDVGAQTARAETQRDDLKQILIQMIKDSKIEFNASSQRDRGIFRILEVINSVY